MAAARCFYSRFMLGHIRVHVTPLPPPPQKIETGRVVEKYGLFIFYNYKDGILFFYNNKIIYSSIDYPIFNVGLNTAMRRFRISSKGPECGLRRVYDQDVPINQTNFNFPF